MLKINLLGNILKTHPRSSFFFCVIKGSAAGSENEKKRSKGSAAGLNEKEEEADVS